MVERCALHGEDLGKPSYKALGGRLYCEKCYSVYMEEATKGYNDPKLREVVAEKETRRLRWFEPDEKKRKDINVKAKEITLEKFLLYAQTREIDFMPNVRKKLGME